MALLRLFYVLASIISITLSQSTCDQNVPSPVVIAVRNVTLDGQVLRRGAELSLGTPPQNLAFGFLPGANGTYIYDGSGDCGNDTAIQCTAVRGGLFNEGSSSTWSLDGKQADAVSAGEVFPWSDNGGIFGADSFQLSLNTSLQRFPLGIIRSSEFQINGLGLGRNSTTLNALSSTNLIPSKIWSLFWGLTGATTSSQMDGNLVFGGYDAAKISGSNYTSKLTNNPNCDSSMIVTVTAITMNLLNGSNPNILGTNYGSALQMCVDASYPIISIPNDTWSNFELFAGANYIARSNGINVWGLTYPVNDVYTGNLTFSFLGGFNITIPNSQLVTPDVSINSEGVTVLDDSTRELQINPLVPPNNNDFPLLGLTFLTSAYLMADLDRGQFTLWEAVANKTQDIRAVTPSSTCIIAKSPQQSATSTIASANPSATNPSPSSQPSMKSASSTSPRAISVGLIVGAAIGGVALVILSVLALMYLRRAKRRRDHRNLTETHSTSKPHLSETSDWHGSWRSQELQELPTDFRPHELGPDQPHEMGCGIPFELGNGLPSPKLPLPPPKTRR